MRPEFVEPAHGRRKARVRCHVDGCRNVMIHGHLTCRQCWKLFKKAERDGLRVFFQECKGEASPAMWAQYETKCDELLALVADRRKENAG